MVVDKIESSRKKVWPAPGFLAGRKALVTGGARRLGRHLARALAEQGADIVLHYNQSDFEAHATADELRSRGVQVVLLQTDLVDSFMAEDLVYRASEAMDKPLDILINNASQYGHGSAQTTSANTWDDFQNVNVRAPFIMAQTLFEVLGEEGRGDVINLNDFRSLRAASDDFAYNMSKWGLHGLTRNLALALAPRLRVNELALGAVLPPSPSSGDYKHTTRDEIPIGRFVTPAEVCSAMLFLLANEAMTGQILNMDGGQSLKC